MRRPLPSVLVAVVGLLALAAPAQAVSDQGLRATLKTLQARMGPASGGIVVDLGTGRTIFSHDADRLLTPASNEKLFVTAAALLRYGPTATLPTTVHGTVGAGGVVNGDLYLVGRGDPSLGDTGLQALAAQLAGLGVTRITGAVVGDESAFDNLRGGPSTAYARDVWLGGSLSALSWAHGRSVGGSPARAAAARLARFLKTQGITYGRRPTTGTMPEVPAAAPPLLTLPSPSIQALAQTTNVASENFYAEMLAKALGSTFAGAGSTVAGLGVVQEELQVLDVAPKLVDGSGLSRSNRTSAGQLVTLLRALDADENAAAWHSTLPVIGRTGTVRHRLRGTAAQDRCAAKTGTLTGASALSGYCTTTGGRRVAFSFLENRVCASCAKTVEDRMVSAIARLDAVPAAAAGR